MSVFVVTIPGTLRGKQRPRMTRAGRAYTPKETVTAEAFVRMCAVEQVGQPVLDGPLALSMVVAMPIPASWSKRKKLDALAGKIMPTGKPDIDNIAKLAGDALNGVLWRDDAQIVRLIASKVYAAKAFTVLTVEAA